LNPSTFPNREIVPDEELLIIPGVTHPIPVLTFPIMDMVPLPECVTGEVLVVPAVLFAFMFPVS
jgi:hypothetical protein